MNRSGEMPYSQSTLGLAAQFFSFPHKIMLQSVSNSNFTGKQKAVLAGYTAAMFGTGATIYTAAADMIFGNTEPSELKDHLRDGMLDWTLNTTLTKLIGKEAAVDWGAFAPTQAFGVVDTLISVLDGDLLSIITESPSGGLLFGNNPRVADAVKTGLRYFSVLNDYEDPALNTTIVDVVKASAAMFSGFSNLFKGAYALETGKKLSSSGRVTDAEVTEAEAILSGLIGLSTQTEEGYRRAYEVMANIDGKNETFSTSDVRQWYNELKRHLSRRKLTVNDDDMSTRVFAEAWRVFGQDRPKAVESLIRAMQDDADTGDTTFAENFMRKMGLYTTDEFWKVVNVLPAGEIRDRAVNMIKTAEDMNNGS
jgi:hypothetical protein